MRRMETLRGVTVQIERPNELQSFAKGLRESYLLRQIFGFDYLLNTLSGDSIDRHIKGTIAVIFVRGSDTPVIKHRLYKEMTLVFKKNKNRNKNKESVVIH